jgi:uroporphyrin-3 C-methyltransferase
MTTDMDPSPTAIASPAPPRRKRSMWPWLVCIALLALLGWRGWQAWQARQASAAAAADAETGRWQALDARIDALRRDQRAQAQRITQSDATNRVLRDEVIGVGERAALLEDSVDRLADPSRHGAQALRLDEVELLLAIGAGRLQLAGDLDGARHAYALAAGVLEGIDDPAYLDLRQALVQEREALDALGADPKVVALQQLDAFAGSLAASAATRPRDGGSRRSWWQRAFSRLVQVRPSNRGVAVAPGDRDAGFVALQLELTLARAAAERRDRAGWKAALARADGWLARLSPPGLQASRQRLARLAELPLQPDLPALGSTLQQLHATRAPR